MKNKIAFKLTIYFAATLLLFSLIIGSVFMVLFKNHTIELHKSDLQKRAVTIAETLSGFANNSGIMGRRQVGYGAYLRFLGDIAMSDVWIVDENLELITLGQMAHQQYNYSDLPFDAESVVKKVFQGEITFSEGFSDILKIPTLTVGTPIKSGNKIVGALLLHSPVVGINEAVKNGFSILSISIGAALMLSVLLSALLAVVFTKPLKKMKNSALHLANGDYTAKTCVQQKDEIGELAETIDILSEQLDQASRESQHLLKLRRDFVANISHELRTPVTVIRGSLEALCEGVVTEPEQVKNYHSQMLNESIFLQRLVNDLLDLSHLQNTDFKMEIQELNLCDIINDAVRSVHNLAKSKNIELKHEQDAPVCVIKGDFVRLRQMLLIILDNAIKFSPSNSTVTISLIGKEVTIKDTGIGIAVEDLPYVFDRFYKVKSEENKNGTGLGLAIAKQIADGHNIEIFINSIKDRGIEFKFNF